jgi:regulator of sirC expression with transglutaminase-like and TPR domain
MTSRKATECYGFGRVMQFDTWTRGSELDLTSAGPSLEIGAALIARDAHPDLDVASVGRALDALALPLEPLRLHQRVPEEAVRAIVHHVYDLTGFAGNTADYGDPRNSYIDDVLTRKRGIPITLAIVLLGVARRLGVAARGVSFPGHFLVRFERSGAGPIMIDPFRNGRALGVDELTELLRRSVPRARLQLRHLEPASTRAILTRVLVNLKNAHTARGDLASALVASTRITTLVPREPWALRDRGILQAQLGAPAAARADLARYLELSPEADDAPRIREVLSRLPSDRAAN